MTSDRVIVGAADEIVRHAVSIPVCCLGCLRWAGGCGGLRRILMECCR